MMMNLLPIDKKIINIYKMVTKTVAKNVTKTVAKTVKNKGGGSMANDIANLSIPFGLILAQKSLEKYLAIKPKPAPKNSVESKGKSAKSVKSVKSVKNVKDVKSVKTVNGGKKK
jgi:hypothetical protein